MEKRLSLFLGIQEYLRVASTIHVVVHRAAEYYGTVPAPLRLSTDYRGSAVIGMKLASDCFDYAQRAVGAIQYTSSQQF